jgi:hypothetical protein
MLLAVSPVAKPLAHPIERDWVVGLYPPMVHWAHELAANPVGGASNCVVVRYPDQHDEKITFAAFNPKTLLRAWAVICGQGFASQRRYDGGAA